MKALLFFTPILAVVVWSSQSEAAIPVFRIVTPVQNTAATMQKLAADTLEAAGCAVGEELSASVATIKAAVERAVDPPICGYSLSVKGPNGQEAYAVPKVVTDSPGDDGLGCESAMRNAIKQHLKVACERALSTARIAELEQSSKAQSEAIEAQKVAVAAPPVVEPTKQSSTLKTVVGVSLIAVGVAAGIWGGSRWANDGDQDACRSGDCPGRLSGLGGGGWMLLGGAGAAVLGVSLLSGAF
jgi:hypothetical protein